MKKSIFRLVSTAVALTALASCNDDLGVDTPKFAQNADMVATIEQFANGNATRMVALDNGQVAGMTGISWEVGEQIRVFTLENLQQDLYEVTSTDGNNGVFKKVEDNSLSGQQYAITMSDAIYGISSSKNADGVYKPLLTVTLPDALTPTAVTGGKAQFPVPYWGQVNQISGTDSNAEVEASMKALTAFLRVNLDELPTGTKYIVLTTHGALPYREGEGFMLADFGSESLGTFADTKDWWYATDPITGEYLNEWVTDGYSEPISGTLNAFLDNPNAELAIDERLVNKDYIVVDLSKLGAVKTFYLPIVCGDYKNLHVIAASYVSPKYTYCYAGTELKDFQDQEFVRNTAYYLDMGLINLPTATMEEINYVIKQSTKVSGLTTVINVDLLTGPGLADKIVTATAGNVILNIREIVPGFPYGYDENHPLVISDLATTSGSVAATTKVKGGSELLNHFVEVNMPSVGNGVYYPFHMYVNEGSRDLVMGTVDGENAEPYYVKIMGSATKFNKTYSLVNAASNTKIENENFAAITFTRGYGIVDIQDATKGDVYAYTPTQAESETEIEHALLINTKEATGIRLDNSLVGDLGFVLGSVAKDNRQVFTTGSSAIKNVCNSTTLVRLNVDKPYVTPAAPETTVGRVTMRSYWNGAALSAYAIQNGYDRPTVYTVAQLASLGEGVYENSLMDSNHEFVDPGSGVLPLVNTYNIPTALVRLMWLGGHEYPWIGARTRVDDFTLDGENVELKNINIIYDWEGETTWIDDPHWCCTTCWKPELNTERIKLDKYFGLIRLIKNNDQATIKNVNLNDVDFRTKLEVDLVGSLVGYVSTKKLTMNDNTIGEVKINVPAIGIGGMAGLVEVDKLTIDKNQVTGLLNESGYITGKWMVGGLVAWARVKALGEVISNNTVTLADGVKSTSSYAGGLIAGLESEGTTDLNNNVVTVKNITSTYSWAAGLIGSIDAKDDVTVLDQYVTVSEDLKAGNQYAGGLFGKVTLPAGKSDKITAATVNVNKLEATNGFAGGFIGQVLEGETWIGNVYPGVRSYMNKIDVAKMTSLYAAGGVIGNNAQSSKSPVKIDTYQNGTKKTELQINVKSWVRTPVIFNGTDNYKYGTMSNIIGHMQDNLTINADKSTAGASYTLLKVVDNLDSETKFNVQYYLHNDEAHNLDIYTNIDEFLASPGQKYIGDANGYVGVRETGTYKIGGTIVKGEQLSPTDLPGHNQYRVAAVWPTYKSKWQ